MSRPLFYTDAMRTFLKENAPKMDRPALTKLFNDTFCTRQTVKSIQAYCKRRGWKSSHDGRFKPGQVSWNTGLAGAGICKQNKGCFKKGQKPKNCKPIGSERICKKDGFILIKTRLGTHSYEHKHRVIWREAGKSVPPGHVLSFKDGNKLNCTLDNLEAVSRAEHINRNRLKIGEQPPETRDTIKAIAKLQTLINEKTHDQNTRPAKSQKTDC